MVWLILLSGLALTAWSAAPIGLGLALTGFAILHFAANGAESLAIMSVWNVFTAFEISSIPLFMFMGDLMTESGLSRQLYRGMAPMFQRIPGKLLHTNIVVCALFGSVAGTSTSTAAAVGTVAYPELKRLGYDRREVVASLAGAGTLGLLIPPSLSLVIYGATQQVSIGRLFLAGTVPGIMIAGFFMIYIWLLCRARPSLTPPGTGRATWGQILRGIGDMWSLVVLLFACMGTVLLGWATATEAAALGVVAAVIIGVIFGDLTLPKIWQAFFNSTVMFGAIGLVMMGALILAQALSILGLPQQLALAIADAGLTKYWVLLAVVAIYLVLGCFFDGVSMMLMTLPLVFPVMTGLGFDAVWLGVIITILVEIGMLTPPVGMNLFILSAITNNEVSLGEAAKASIPYWLILLASVGLLTIFPDIALALTWLMD